MSSVFLLSPASTTGKRAAILLDPGAEFELAKRGLLSPDTPVDLEELREFAARARPEDHVVLLGSIATNKYVEPLGAVFGERLVFPAEFVGRGDMSRGGLMLRSVLAGQELDYIPVATAARRGARPPRLETIPR